MVHHRLKQPHSNNHTDHHLMLSTDKCLTVPPGHTLRSYGNNKSARNSHIPPKYYKGLLELTSTIPTYTCTPGHVHGSLSGPPYWWLWGWDQWVGGWQGDLLWPQATVAWRGPPFLFYFFLISPFQRSSTVYTNTSPYHSLTHSLIHSLTHTFIHSFTHSFIHSVIHSLKHSSIQLYLMSEYTIVIS